MIDAIGSIIAADARVRKVILFGSRAKGSWREGSDIDLAVYGDDLGRSDAARWADELEEALFPWSIDVVVVDNEVDPDLRAHIERAGRVIFSRDKQ
ncbi:MAG: nucleotidyltransferase domain-containing protein [Spirochaetia bacterium]